MRNILLILFIVTSFIVKAQLTIIIESVPESTPTDADIYFAGNINGWSPGDEAYKLTKPAENIWELILPAMDEGTEIQFKFTRGSWETVEKGANGEEIGDRTFTFGNGDTINPIILNWADGSSGGSTASENVSIMSEDFYMPQLDRNRRIWIYLPPDYSITAKLYPVLYMHDGQNLFDTETSYAGEWEVDETLDELYNQSFNVPIIIGIDNEGTERINEYTPWANAQYGGGDGDKYVEFIVETLKPYVDENYRTLTDRENTAIMGSSLGGLISHYAALKYQDVFSKAGLFSPSYWFSDSVWIFTDNHPKQFDMRIYQMIGGDEGGQNVDNLSVMEDHLLNNGFDANELYKKTIPNGSHNEALWRGDFEAAYKWLFLDYIGGIDNIPIIKNISVSPNPARNEITISNYNPRSGDSLEITDIRGVDLILIKNVSDKKIDISGLKPGIYVLRVFSDNEIYGVKFVKN